MKTHAVVLAALAIALTQGCSDEPKPGPGPAEKAGAQIDQAVESAGAKTQAALDKAGQKSQAALEKARNPRVRSSTRPARPWSTPASS